MIKDDRPFRPNVGIVLRNNANQIWVGSRIDSDKAFWQMPQGGIEDGESPLQAVYREMQEEIGLIGADVRLDKEYDDWIHYTLPYDVSVNIWGGKYQGQKQKWFYFTMLSDDENIAIDTPVPEFSDWCWMSAQDVIKNAIPFKKDVYQKIVKNI